MHLPEWESWWAAQKWLTEQDLDPVVRERVYAWLDSLWDHPRPFYSIREDDYSNMLDADVYFVWNPNFPVEIYWMVDDDPDDPYFQILETNRLPDA